MPFLYEREALLLNNSEWITGPQFSLLGSKRKFSSNYLELSILFLIFALSFGEMDDDIEESD